MSKDYRGWSPVNELRIVPLADIFVHEDVRESRADSLIERLKRDKILRDPIIVAPLESGKYKYVHLDGANRYVALQQLQCKHILVQVVNYHDETRVNLETWCHLFEFEEQEFLDNLNHINGIGCEEINPEGNTIVKSLCESRILCYAAFRGGAVYAITGGTELVEKVRLLREVSKLYPYDATREPFDSEQYLEQQVRSLFGKSENNSCNVLLVFPRFTPQDIVFLAELSQKIPAGITRHVVAKRILCVNIPLSRLCADGTTEEKTRWLEGYLSMDIVSGEELKEPYRFFGESTIIFQSRCNAFACELTRSLKIDYLSESHIG